MTLFVKIGKFFEGKLEIRKEKEIKKNVNKRNNKKN